jgi:acyl carrier protein
VSGPDPEVTTPPPLPRLRDRLAAALPAARPRVLVEFILQKLQDELAIEGDELHPRARFESLGIDSKRALEFKELLDEELQCTLRTTLMFDYPTPESLAAYIVQIAFGDPQDTAPAAPAAPERPGEASLSGDEALSIEEQLRRKLAQYDI